jgi:hypothetical protein
MNLPIIMSEGGIRGGGVKIFSVYGERQLHHHDIGYIIENNLLLNCGDARALNRCEC